MRLAVITAICRRGNACLVVARTQQTAMLAPRERAPGTQALARGVAAALAERGVSALMVGADSFLAGRFDKIAALAARHAIPAIYENRSAVRQVVHVLIENGSNRVDGNNW